MKTVVYDMETSGVDPKTCGVCQVAAVDLDTHETLFNEYAMPGVRISKDASDVHGFTEAILLEKKAPPEFNVMINFISEVGLKADILAGYNNNSFDDTILKRHWPDMLDNVQSFDLFRYVLRTKLLDSYKLGDVYNRFFPDFDKALAHEAAYDCVMVAKLIQLLVPDVAKAAKELLTPAEIKVMPFGKHKGKPIYKLPRPYMRYMLKLDLNPDLKFSFQEELKRRPGIKR